MSEERKEGVKRFYVYELIDPIDAEVFYVGKGTGDRINAHEREARRGRQSRKCARIRKIIDAGFLVEKRIVKSFVDEMEAYLFEADLIEAYGLHNLTNVVPGGGGALFAHKPSIFKDREMVRACAIMIRNYRSVAAVRIAGKIMDLAAVRQAMISSVSKIAVRRGSDWVNAISSKMRVEFAHG